jgi:hypothetical protein
MFAISALDVAFVSAIAAVAAAVAAPLSAWLLAIANNRHDRWVKTYGDLREAYVSCLRAIYSERGHAGLLALMFEKDDPSIYEAAHAFRGHSWTD